MEQGTGILLEMLEVFINSILYIRNFYSPGIFRSRKMYSVPVNISIYPPLNEYIKQILKSAQELVQNKQLHRLELSFYKDNDVFIEKYIFELDNKIDFIKNCDNTNDKYLIDFEEDIRKSLLCMDERLKHLKKLPEDAKFKIFLHTTQSGLVKLTHNVLGQEFPWIKDNGENSNYCDKRAMIPIGLMKLCGVQFYVEEYL